MTRRREWRRARHRRRIPGNLAPRPPFRSRAPSGLERLEPPAGVRLAAERGVPEEEQRRVFNCGIGYCGRRRLEDAGAATS